MSSSYQLPIEERKTINESVFLDSLNTTIKLLVAVKEDEEILLRYICDQFSRYEPIDSATGISPTDLAKRYKSTLQHSLEHSFTIVAVDCFEICGMITANRVKVGKKRSDALKDDYTNEIQSSNAHCLAAKQIEVFVNEFESFTPNFLPDDCQEFLRIDLFSVLDEYRGSGLGTRLWLECLKRAHEHKFRFVESGCSAKASTNIGVKLGMKIAYSFPYKQFCANGKPVFGEILGNGSTQANLLIGDLDEIAKSFDQKKFQLPTSYKLNVIDRELVEELFIPKLNRSLRLEVAVSDDDHVIKLFLAQEFCKQGPMTRTMQSDKVANHEMVTKFYDPASFGNGLSLIVTDNGYLSGVLYNRIKKIDHGEPLKEWIKEDFTNEIDTDTECESLSLRKLSGFIDWLQAFVPQHLPNDCHEVFYIDCLSVHPEFRGCKLGEHLWRYSLKRAHRQGYKYAYAICTAIASTKIALNCKMGTTFVYPMEALKYRGERMFPTGKLYEGCSEASLIIGDLARIFNEK